VLQVEAGMVESVRECCRQGVASYPQVPRQQWVLQWPGQVVLVVTAVFWTQVRGCWPKGVPLLVREGTV
jgi:dynein heavy chain, axonemal